MSDRKILDALFVTDKNIQEIVHSLKKQLEDDNIIMRILVRASEAYDDSRGKGAYKKLVGKDKELYLCRYSILNGYIEALTDVQIAQQTELEAIGIDF